MIDVAQNPENVVDNASDEAGKVRRGLVGCIPMHQMITRRVQWCIGMHPTWLNIAAEVMT